MKPTMRKTGLHNRPSTRRVLAMVAAVAVSSIGWSKIADQSPEGMTLGAEIADASPLINGVDVKIGGVPVGTVSNMTIVPGENGAKKRARITMNLENEALPVHRDARVTVRASSLLGERFVDLDRGSASAPPLAPGKILPPSQASQATDLDQVLNTFDQPTGQALAELLTALGQGMDGQGSNLAATLEALGPAMSDTGRVTSVLKDQNALLGRLVDRVEPVAGALAENNGATLNQLVNAANRLTDTTARRHSELSNTVAELPSTLSTARRTLDRLNGTANDAAPTLKALRPATDNLTAISRELKTFSSSGTKALAHAKPVLEHAEKLLVKTRPVAAELRRTAPELRKVSKDARPIVDSLAGNVGNVLDFIRNWALTTNGQDGISHYFRAQLVVSPELLQAVTGEDSGGTKSGKDKTGKGPKLPDLPDVPKLPKLPKVPKLPGGLLDSKKSSGGGVTGLTEKQELGAVDFLLGGDR